MSLVINNNNDDNIYNRYEQTGTCSPARHYWFSTRNYYNIFVHIIYTKSESRVA